MAHETELGPPEQEALVFVGVFQGLVNQVRAFRHAEDAEQAFEDYCGISYHSLGETEEKINFKFEGSGIYHIRLE